MRVAAVLLALAGIAATPVSARATTNGVSSTLPARTSTMSFSDTRYDGMSTFLPLTVK